jgi:hypothetical protein
LIQRKFIQQQDGLLPALQLLQLLSTLLLLGVVAVDTTLLATAAAAALAVTEQQQDLLYQQGHIPSQLALEALRQDRQAHKETTVLILYLDPLLLWVVAVVALTTT